MQRMLKTRNQLVNYSGLLEIQDLSKSYAFLKQAVFDKTITSSEDDVIEKDMEKQPTEAEQKEWIESQSAEH